MEPVYASVDLGGTSIKAAIGNARGEILRADAVPTRAEEGPERVIERIAGLVESLAREAGSMPAALGMGCPGLVDLARGTTRFLPNLPGQWRDVPVRDLLGARIRCPIHLLNDVRMAALGELTFGRGRGARTFVFFAIGTGIGGGVAIDGRLRLGPLGAAGELGHQTIIPDGPRCGCGNRGCLEALASAPAIAAEGARLMEIGLAPNLRARTGGDASRVTPKAMAEAAGAGDAAIREAIVRAAEYLGIGVANAIVAIHPELVVLGGGVAGIGELLFDAVRRTVRERVRMLPVEGIEIEPSLLGDRAGSIGGIALARMGGTLGG